MNDPQLKLLLEMLARKAYELGSEVLENGIKTVLDRVHGRVTDDQIMEALVALQDEEAQEAKP